MSENSRDTRIQMSEDQTGTTKREHTGLGWAGFPYLVTEQERLISALHACQLPYIRSSSTQLLLTVVLYYTKRNNAAVRIHMAMSRSTVHKRDRNKTRS